MTEFDSAQNGYPLCISGMPRAGTTFLFSVLATCPEFSNTNYMDKELRYFERLLGHRPWGKIDGVSREEYEGIDRHIMPELLRTLDSRLRLLRGGPRGHYINGNPRDLFCSLHILDVVPDARFIVAIRDPLTQVWSALNYPSHEWGQREASGFFREADVRNTAEHWKKVAWFITNHELQAQPSSFLILEQERLVTAERQLHDEIERFLGLPGVASRFDEHANLIVHSSFLDEGDEGRGRDRRFADREQKVAHFQYSRSMFVEDGRFAGMVLDICGYQLENLVKLGFMRSGPAWRLLASHGAARKQSSAGAAALTSSVYLNTAQFLLERLAATGPGTVLTVGCGADVAEDPVIRYLCGHPSIGGLIMVDSEDRACSLRALLPERRDLRIQVAFSVLGSQTSSGSLPQAALTGVESLLEFAGADVDVLQIATGEGAAAAAMGFDWIASRPRLVLIPELRVDPAANVRLRNMFANLGYLAISIGTGFLAARRDSLDEGLECELREFDGSAA